MFTGANGAGKTSYLEALYLLGRGRSFRVADKRSLIQAGHQEARVSGKAWDGSRPGTLGLAVSASGLDIHVLGQGGRALADLAAAFPVQVIHPDTASLVQGPPEARRRLVDWGVFHVEHGFLEDWRQYRRALAQRNSALRDGSSAAVLAAWDQAVAQAAEPVGRARRAYFEKLLPLFGPLSQRLLGTAARLNFQQGWSGETGLEAALKASREADRAAGYTRSGPHRADVTFEWDGLNARGHASRGQQKILGAALVLAQAQLVGDQAGRPLALLLDEPAADLDGEKLAELLNVVFSMPGQVFLASITTDGLNLPGSSTVFHVEHGEAKASL